MWNLNPRTWLQAFLEKCAQAGGKAPDDIRPSLPWNLTPEDSTTGTATPTSPTQVDKPNTS
jgi:hypothetical protein